MHPTQDPNALLFAQVAAAGDSNDYAERFLAGEHVVALNVCEPKNTQDHGQIISVDFVVVDSTVQGYAGRTCGEGYFVQKSDKEGGKGARQRAFSLAKAVVQSLGGNPDDPTIVMGTNGQPVLLPNGQPLTQGVALVQQTLAEMSRQDQPWRGVILRASASKKAGKNTGKEYTNVRYSPISQTAQQIGLMRQKIEAANATAAAANAATQTAAPAAQPMIQGYPAPAQTVAPTAQQVQYQPPAATYPAPAQMTQPTQGAFVPAPAQPTTAAPAVAAPFGGGPSLLGR